PWMPELSDQAGAVPFDGSGDALETVLVVRVISRDDRRAGQRSWIDGENFRDDQPGPALGALGEKVEPAIRDAMACAVIGGRRRQRDAVAQGPAADPQWREQARKGLIRHVAALALICAGSACANAPLRQVARRRDASAMPETPSRAALPAGPKNVLSI